MDALRNNMPPDDILYMVSDPEINVRAFGNLYIVKYHLTNLEVCLGARLLETNRLGRISGLQSITQMLGAKGLPYYSVLISDDDQELASEAASGFALCRREDASPHLLSFLENFGQSPGRNEVVIAVIHSLQKLYGEKLTEVSDVKSSVTNWIRILKADQTAKKASSQH